MTNPHPLAGLFGALLQDQAIAAATTSAARTGADRTEDLEISLPDGARAPLVALLAGAGGDPSGLSRPSTLLLVTATSRESEDLAAD
ncbi:MAG: hypothetical protein ACTH3G_11215, partial [Citricoccus sp.]